MFNKKIIKNFILVGVFFLFANSANAICISTIGVTSLPCGEVVVKKFPNNIDTFEEKINLQNILNLVLVPSSNLIIDGIIGKNSIRAIKNFQNMRGLKVDGIVGPITRRALEVAQIGSQFIYNNSKIAVENLYQVDNNFSSNINNQNQENFIYIDSTYSGNIKNGTEAYPFNSWDQIIIQSNKTYLFKRGTTIYSYKGFGFTNLKNVNYGAYGSGNKPKLIYTGNDYALKINFYNEPQMQKENNSNISDLEISASKNAIALVKLDSNVSIENSYLHNAQWGIRVTGQNISNIKIKNCLIEDISDDGIFIQGVDGILIEDNIIRKVNQNYFLIGPNQDQASGDGVQINKSSNWQILNNKIDRSDTGNKFALIITENISRYPNILTIKDNEFITPKKTNQGGAGVYLDLDRDEVDLVNNKIFGETEEMIYWSNNG